MRNAPPQPVEELPVGKSSEKRVSVFESRIDPPTLAGIVNLIRLAKRRAEGRTDAMLTLLKDLLSDHYGQTWFLAYGSLSSEFGAAVTCDMVDAQVLGGVDNSSGELDGSGVYEMQLEARVGKGKLYLWRQSQRLQTAMPVSNSKRLQAVVYFVALLLLVAWFYARRRCNSDCFQASVDDGSDCPGGDEAIAAAEFCRERVNWFVYAAVAVFMLSPAVRMGRRMGDKLLAPRRPPRKRNVS